MPQYVMVIESRSIVKVEGASKLVFPMDSVRFQGNAKIPKHNPMLPGAVPVVRRCPPEWPGPMGRLPGEPWPGCECVACKQQRSAAQRPWGRVVKGLVGGGSSTCGNRVDSSNCSCCSMYQISSGPAPSRGHDSPPALVHNLACLIQLFGAGTSTWPRGQPSSAANGTSSTIGSTGDAMAPS